MLKPHFTSLRPPLDPLCHVSHASQIIPKPVRGQRHPPFNNGQLTASPIARVGGGIYTKAADVGADLVGKVVTVTYMLLGAMPMSNMRS